MSAAPVSDGQGMLVDRVLGRVRGDSPGPTLFCVGGIHGNEPAGVKALQQVLARLGPAGGIERGEFVALAGNLTALKEGRRYVRHDLNRAWTPERLTHLKNGGRDASSIEEGEQIELLDTFEAVLRGAGAPVFLLDLHTTSGAGGPFVTVSDTLVNRDFGRSLPTPMILGLEELVTGTLLEYMNERGLVTAGFESGQHDEPEAVDRAEAAVWLAMEAVGILPASLADRATAARDYLERDTRGLPRVLEMRYRHDVAAGAGFRMKPGYLNFQPVQNGEVLAHDAGGEIKAPETARILMPLYQEQGDDGFFVVREFARFWLWLSRVVRRLPIDRFVHWLPGIRRDPADPRILEVDRRVARLFALQLFHLMGYRRQREDGSRLLVIARRPGDRS